MIGDVEYRLYYALGRGKVARHSWNLRDVCVDGTTVILSGTFRIGSFV